MNIQNSDDKFRSENKPIPFDYDKYPGVSRPKTDEDKPKKKHKCICTLQQIMLHGCECGAFESEQDEE